MVGPGSRRRCYGASSLGNSGPGAERSDCTACATAKPGRPDGAADQPGPANSGADQTTGHSASGHPTAGPNAASARRNGAPDDERRGWRVIHGAQLNAIAMPP